MNRQIKFRGQIEDTKEWVYGSLCKAKNSIFIVYGDDFYQNIIIDSVCLMSDRFFKAISNTVGQFTGLVDKNGKEIYEGDIILTKHPFMGREHIGIVIFEEYMFNIDGFGMSHFDYPNIAFSEGTRYMEVIGNIHDNKELLK